MSWLSKFFGPEEVTISTEVDESEVLSAKQLLDRVAEQQDLEPTGQENDFYCGLCRGWVPISQFKTHGH